MFEKLRKIKALRIAAICVLTYLFIGVLVTGGTAVLFGGGAASLLELIKMIVSWPLIVWFIVAVLLRGF